jgi:hypothetical protein
MNTRLQDLVFSWKDWPAALEQLLRKPAAGRAAGVAGLLRKLAPLAPLAACCLDGADGPALAVARNGGKPRQMADRLRQRLSGIDWRQPIVHRVPLGKGFADLQGLAAAVAARSSNLGFLLVGVPPETPASLLTGLELLLAWAAHVLALHLLLDASEQRGQALLEERRQVEELATAGDAMTGLVHRLNNTLNSMVLQAAVVQLKAPEPLHEAIAPIRREGAQAAALLRPFQHLRDRRQQPGSPVDLNQVLKEVLAEDPERAGRVRTKPATGLVSLSVEPGPLKRLIRGSLRVVLGSLTAPDRRLEVRTATADRQVLLVLETRRCDTPGQDTIPHAARIETFSNV